MSNEAAERTDLYADGYYAGWLEAHADGLAFYDSQVRLRNEMAEADMADEHAALIQRIRLALEDDHYLSETPVGDLHAATVLDHVYAILDSVLRDPADRCDHIVNNGMGEPTECGRWLPCEYHAILDAEVAR